MQNQEQEKILLKYSLTQKEIEDITQTILHTLTYNKLPSSSPLAIIVGGQPGAGKTALINYTSSLSSEKDFITIDNDFFRNFHPKAREIKANCPQYFTLATDQLGMGITSNVINYCVDNKYDIILHQTLKNSRIGDDAIAQLRDSGYTVGVRVFAVPFYESAMSQIERYLGQAEKLGYCRYATPEGHLTAYLGLPKTVDYLEQNGLYDFLQIYKRSKDISHPKLVYTKFNPQTEEKTLSVLSNCENAPYETNTNGFLSAKDAVLKTRAFEAKKLKPEVESRITEATLNPYNNPNIQLRIDELEQSLSITNSNKPLPLQILEIKPFENKPDVNEYITSLKESFLHTQNSSVGIQQFCNNAQTISTQEQV